MQIDYFDIPNEPEIEVNLFWPVQILHVAQKSDNDLRLYYAQLPDAKEVVVKFFCVTSQTELPATFPGKYVGSAIPGLCHDTDDQGDAMLNSDTATHLFLETPVNQPTKPIVVKRTAGANGNGTD